MEKSLKTNSKFFVKFTESLSDTTCTGCISPATFWNPQERKAYLEDMQLLVGVQALQKKYPDLGFSELRNLAKAKSTVAVHVSYQFFTGDMKKIAWFLEITNNSTGVSRVIETSSSAADPKLAANKANAIIRTKCANEAKAQFELPFETVMSFSEEFGLTSKYTYRVYPAVK